MIETLNNIQPGLKEFKDDLDQTVRSQLLLPFRSGRDPWLKAAAPSSAPHVDDGRSGG